MNNGELINELTDMVNRVLQASPEVRDLMGEAKRRSIEVNAVLEIKVARLPSVAWLEKLYGLEDKR